MGLFSRFERTVENTVEGVADRFSSAPVSPAAIAKKVDWVAPVKVYPGENELESLAENGYIILAGATKIHTYNKDHLIED